MLSATQTGIGKTIAFTVPIIHKLLPKKNPNTNVLGNIFISDKKFSQ